MYDFQRQHPIAAISRAFTMIRGNLITIIVFLFIGAQSESFSFLLMIGGGFLLLMISGVLDWWRFLFKVEEGEMHIKRGIFVRKNIYLTKDRVQVIDISSGVIQRLFGLVKIDIQTAGSTSRAAIIEAVPLETAKEIKQKLSRNGNGQAEDEQAKTDSNRVNVYGLPNKDLLIAASTSGRFGIALSVLGTLFSQIEPVIRESNLFEYLFSLLPSQTDTFMIITIIVMFVSVAWLISFFSTLFMYGDFSLEINDDEMIISRGILEKKRITVPYKRIQALFVTEGIIRQPLGYCSVHIHSAGYGDEQGSGAIVLFPLIKRDKVESLIEKVVPHYDVSLPGITPPKRALRRYIFRSAAILTVVTAVLYWIFSLTNWIWLIPILSVWWGWLKYKDAAIGWDDANVVISNRKLAKNIAIVKRDRIQDVSVSASWIQRFRNLCSTDVHVASGDHGSSFSIDDIEESDGERYLNAINSKLLVERQLPTMKASEPVILPGW
ncbi:PH domain-containing protein [Rhodohalobacter sp. 8-1]|uniref:PH domain-containing protein n=1 Tax=Rhodohalobacter sp. 8-1 TaxID=3131972 RepID=UPI0030EE1D3F